MNSYVVLARKWRPSQFADLVGQTPVVRTLVNAIQSSRIHQAYLLTGSRGIGKTSIARIFAKVVRCPNTKTETTNGESSLKTCDACSNCNEITAGNSVDVIEIDGASNNGVDAIREVRENVKFLPSSGSKKIYIIDEVHMLTTAAFNALLKTLEEPPPHIIFILATTEPHKIPATILSRCQRFDLKRVTLSQIQGRLEQVIQAEGIQADLAALSVIAKASDGSMRDALSLLDQVIAYSGNKVTAQTARDSVGLVPQDVLFKITDAILSRNATQALSQIEASYNQGLDLKELTKGLVETLHAVLLSKVGVASNPELSKEEIEQSKTLSALRPIEEIELIFQILHHGVESLARATQPKIILDILIIKCALAETFVNSNYTNTQTTHTSVAPVRTAPVTQAAAHQPSVSPQNHVIKTESTESSPNSNDVSKTPKTYDILIDRIKTTRPLLASILENSVCGQMPSASNDNTLVISFSSDNAYFKEQLGSKVYHEQLLHFTKDYFERVIRVQVTLGAVKSTPTESVSARREREANEKTETAKSEVRNHPIIREATALFGAELGSIEILSESSEGGGK